MDAESFLEFASQVTKWKMYPYFDVAHSVLCALHVRDDLGPGNDTVRSRAAQLAFVRVKCLISHIFLLVCRSTSFFP